MRGPLMERGAATRLGAWVMAGLVCAVVSGSICANAAPADAAYRMHATAVGEFAPVYPALAKQLVQDYGITEGICVDVGSGCGHLALELAKTTRLTIYCLDIDPAAVRLCAQHADDAGLTERIIPVLGDALNMPFKDGFADLVVSRGSIPFWKDQAQGLRECYRILKPGGVGYVGGGFSRLLPQDVRDKIVAHRKEALGDTPPDKWNGMGDLSARAREAGIPGFKEIREPEMGWWIEMRKPAAPGKPLMGALLQPMYAELAKQIVGDFGVKKGLALEIGSGDLGIEMAKLTDMQLYVLAPNENARRAGERNAASAGVADRVTFVVGQPEDMVFRDNAFPLIVSRAVITSWRDQPKALREINRVLQPGGATFVGGGWGRNFAKDRVAAVKVQLQTAGVERLKPVLMTDLQAWLRQAGLKGKVCDDPGCDTCGGWVELSKPKGGR